MSLDLDKIRQLHIQHNAVLLLPETTDQHTIQELSNALGQLHPRHNTLIICGLDLQQLTEAEMNAAGWYRK
ncbi:MAG: hypothetical protein ACRBBM_12465 [Pseudomonadaceae bacterium]